MCIRDSQLSHRKNTMHSCQRNLFSSFIRWVRCTSRVCVGSVILFLIYINDMPLTVESILAFCLLMTRSCIATILQNNLDKLVLWEENWSIEFHPKISKVLRITNKRKPINTTYKIHNEELENNNAKYLGVTINKHNLERPCRFNRLESNKCSPLFTTKPTSYLIMLWLAAQNPQNPYRSFQEVFLN